MRFTIRDLMWLMVVVALAISLWSSRTEIKRMLADLDQVEHFVLDLNERDSRMQLQKWAFERAAKRPLK